MIANLMAAVPYAKAQQKTKINKHICAIIGTAVLGTFAKTKEPRPSENGLIINYRGSDSI